MMRNVFLILGWLILLAIIWINRLLQPLSDAAVIGLGILSAVFLCTGILMKQKS